MGSKPWQIDLGEVELLCESCQGRLHKGDAVKLELVELAPDQTAGGLGFAHELLYDGKTFAVKTALHERCAQ